MNRVCRDGRRKWVEKVEVITISKKRLYNEI